MPSRESDKEKPAQKKTEQKKRAAYALVLGKTVVEAAKEANVSTRTVLRWRKDDAEFLSIQKSLEHTDDYRSSEVVRAVAKSSSVCLNPTIFTDEESEHRKRLSPEEALWFDTAERTGMPAFLRDTAKALTAQMSERMHSDDAATQFFQIVIDLATEYVSRHDNPYGMKEIDRLTSRLTPDPNDTAAGLERVARLYKQSISLIHGERLQLQQNILLDFMDTVLMNQYNLVQLRQLAQVTLIDFARAAGDVESITRGMKEMVK